MSKLEELTPNAAVRGILPDALATVVSVQWFGSEALELTYKTPSGKVANELLYRHDESRVEVVEQGRPWSFDEAHKRADGLQARLQKRMEELKLEKQIAPLHPVVIGDLLVGTSGLLAAMKGEPTGGKPTTPKDTQVSAAKARAVIMQVERELGFVPTDRETEKLGYDVESRIPGMGKLRFIEVKGRVAGAPTITVTKNEILYSLNKPDDFILAIVEFDGDAHRVYYVRRPFNREPDFGVTSVNYDFAELLQKADAPR